MARPLECVGICLGHPNPNSCLAKTATPADLLLGASPPKHGTIRAFHPLFLAHSENSALSSSLILTSWAKTTSVDVMAKCLCSGPLHLMTPVACEGAPESGLTVSNLILCCGWTGAGGFGPPVASRGGAPARDFPASQVEAKSPLARHGLADLGFGM